MRNADVAKILYEIADLLEVQDIQFKPRAYRKAAQSIESMSEDIVSVWKKGKLDDIPGVGKSIAEKIDEFLKTGKLKYLNELKKKLPIDIEEITAVEGVGVKKAKVLYEKLKVKTLKDLEKAAKAHKIRKIAGFGTQTEENILKNLGFAATRKKRMPLGYVLPIVEEIMEQMKAVKEVQKIDIAGSVRRMKETIGDVDILVVSKKPSKVMEKFTHLKDTGKIISKGPTRSSIRMKSGLHVDLRVIPVESYGSATQYFTGDKAHNIELRKIAIKKKMKLSEYGLFKGKKQIAGRNEKDIYRILGLSWMPPEIRENNGEIEAALKHKLPHLVEYDDIKGDLHTHTKASDGTNTIKEMATAAKKAGLKYIAVTDHTGKLKIAGGLDNKNLLKHAENIRKESRKMSGIKLLTGAEVNIKDDGTVDIKDSVLKQLDVVVAAIHSGFRGSSQKMTKRIMTAMENEHVDIIAHPTGVLLGKRRPYDLNYDKILEKAKETKTALEINCFPVRMDLDTSHIRDAVERKVVLAIGTDGHNTEHFRFLQLGCALARRGWCEKNNILNTYDLSRLSKWLK
ncbi:DNA polymerase/3'-5' exonuclease PolX [Candidatus Woesearchaeota archaeon]|nr:DNA polymerase/3'-5' exonuclease PolX [Candidatus Woesearchaeota archaeon]MBW3017998.1 DNA polymerase/3'-5' exonuclease PolX [Candidatus Woesearchaeota archaeon]